MNCQLHICTPSILIIWEATTYCHFSLLFHKKMTMRKEVQQKSWTSPLLCKKKKMLLNCFPLSDLISQMENLWYFWLAATRNHMRRTRKKDTKAIFISSTELLRNAFISFLAETDKTTRRGSLSNDQLLQLIMQYCYLLNFYMFYAKCLCENRPSNKRQTQGQEWIQRACTV